MARRYLRATNIVLREQFWNFKRITPIIVSCLAADGRTMESQVWINTRRRSIALGIFHSFHICSMSIDTKSREMVQRLTGKKSRRWGSKCDLESKKTGMGREEGNGLPLRNKGMLDVWKGGRDDARVSVYFNLNVFELFVGTRSRYSKCTIAPYRTIRTIREQMSLPIFGRGKKQRILGRSPIRLSMTDKGLTCLNTLRRASEKKLLFEK